MSSTIVNTNVMSLSAQYALQTKSKGLRSCLETTASSQAVSHQSNHCEINPGFAARHQALVVLAQTA